MNLKFLGANRQVTGSCYHLSAGGLSILIDGGLFQEREFIGRNWNSKPVDLKRVDYLLLTHAHLDHCGLIPRLVREGFCGKIITTEPSVEMAQIVMADSARIQEEDVKYKQKRHRKEKKKSRYPYEPLYSVADAERVGSLMQGVDFDNAVKLTEDVVVYFREAGHILGAAMLEIVVREERSTRRLLFSGDIGQWDVPIVGDPALISQADVVVMESTYGDRDHEKPDDILSQLADVIQETLCRGGNLVIPTFAIERAQELMLYLARLIKQKRIPPVPVFLDSPMAVNVTEVFRRHHDFMGDKTRRLLESGELDEAWRSIKLVRSVNESKAINEKRGTYIVLAGSGMCTGGRIKHHLVHNIERPESTILFVGYQASGTLGRRIIQEPETVRIFGRQRQMRAHVRRIYGLSAHAGRQELLHWLGHFQGAPKHLFLTHGEEKAALKLARQIRDEWGWEVQVPTYLSTHEF